MHMMKEIGKPEKAKTWIENALDKKKLLWDLVTEFIGQETLECLR